MISQLGKRTFVLRFSTEYLHKNKTTLLHTWRRWCEAALIGFPHNSVLPTITTNMKCLRVWFGIALLSTLQVEVRDNIHVIFWPIGSFLLVLCIFPCGLQSSTVASFTIVCNQKAIKRVRDHQYVKPNNA